MSAHKRQFLIGNQPKQVKEDWKTVRLGDSFFLSHCPGLLAASAKDLNGETWHLLGLAVQTDKEKEDPLTEISRSATSQIRDIYKSWTGRWILISAAEVHIDFYGMIGCFYATVNEARWISGSLAILQEIGGFTPRPETLKHKSSIEWYPLPTSKFEGVSKLLPTQILNLKTFRVEARALAQPIAGLSYEAIVEKLEDKLKFALVNASRFAKRIFIPLTAGYDSRLLLAITHAAGIKAETYTTGHHYISHADATLPAKLSKMAGYRHHYIKKGRFSKEKEALYDYHTARNTADIDRLKFSHGQWNPFGKGDLILRGGGFEVGRCIYWKRTGADFTIASVLKSVRLGYDPEAYSTKAFLEWMNWAAQTPTEGVDWRDRFYIEQRVAGWLSGVEQSLDLTETECFYLVNCHDIVSLLLSIPVEKRKATAHHIDLIRKMSPALLKHPFNPPDSDFRKLQKKMIRISKKPFPELYKKLRHKFIKSTSLPG